MLRKVDSSAGAGLNGEGMCDVEEGLEVIALAGGLPELFLALGIVAPLCTLAAPGEITKLMISGSSRPVSDPEASSTLL